MIWFTSDEHYGHANIIKFCKRPFANITAMRNGLIERHNSRVSKGDQVFHIGDMFWRTLSEGEALYILARLKGEHFYIYGNHEELVRSSPAIQKVFVTPPVERTMIKPQEGPKYGIVLDHFAGRVWQRSDRGSWQLYGHSHGGLMEDDAFLSLDVGVDANDGYPISLDEVTKRMESKLRWQSKQARKAQNRRLLMQ